MTRRSRRFSAFIGCFCNDRLGNYGNINFVHEVEVDFYFLLPLAAGLVQCRHNNLLDILIHNRLCQLLHIHIFLCQCDKGIQAVIHFFPLLHPFLDNFNFEFQPFLFFLIGYGHLLVSVLAQFTKNVILIKPGNEDIQIGKSFLCLFQFLFVIPDTALLVCPVANSIIDSCRK